MSPYKEISQGFSFSYHIVNPNSFGMQFKFGGFLLRPFLVPHLTNAIDLFFRMMLSGIMFTAHIGLSL